MRYTIELIQAKIEFLKGRIKYAKHMGDVLLETKCHERIKEMEKAIEILSAVK